MTSSTASPATRATTAALLAGPAVVALGMALTPWEDEKTTASYQAALLAHPTRAQLAALALVVGYALMTLTYLTVLRHAGSAPRKLLLVAQAAAFCSVVLPGMVSVDFYDLALARKLDAAQAVAVADAATASAGAVAVRVLAGIGFVLGTLLVTCTAWRAKLVGGWAPLVLVASFVVPGLAFGAVGVIVGSLCTVAVFAAIAVGLQPRRVRSRVPVRVGATA